MASINYDDNDFDNNGNLDKIILYMCIICGLGAIIHSFF